MKTKLFTTSLAIFFLVLFASTKVLGLHEFLHNHSDHQSHHEHQDHPEHYGQFDLDCSDDHQDQKNDEEEDCGFCDKILLDYFSSYDGGTQSADISEVPQQFFEHSSVEYTSEPHTTELTTVLFSRPPPALS
jgi:hypothetical protein